MEADITSQAVGLASNTDFSLVSLFLRADIIVKSVMIILVAFSIYSWAIIFDKIRLFRKINKSAEEFEEKFWKSKSAETYTVITSNLELDESKKKSIAEGITKIHSKTTGANTYFAQVIFNETKKNSHFMGGKVIKDEQIYLNGQIRAGRSKEVKDDLIDQLKKLLAEETKLDQSNVWVYIVDLEPSQMVEYGEVLPVSGQEKVWFENLPDKLKKKLKSLES